MNKMIIIMKIAKKEIILIILIVNIIIKIENLKIIVNLMKTKKSVLIKIMMLIILNLLGRIMQRK